MSIRSFISAKARSVSPYCLKKANKRVIAILSAGNFFGEGCLAGQLWRTDAAQALTECTIVRIEKSTIIRALQDEPAFSRQFMSHLLARNIRIEEDLIDQLLNSSEKCLARCLLLLGDFAEEVGPEPLLDKISQELLAQMIGTTRSRVNFFMNKFRQLGFIDYKDGRNDGLHIHKSLRNVIRRE
jgi:CRP/FNR family cyclic AMP-dependent transcriptional regulator